MTKLAFILTLGTILTLASCAKTGNCTCNGIAGANVTYDSKANRDIYAKACEKDTVNACKWVDITK